MSMPFKSDVVPNSLVVIGGTYEPWIAVLEQAGWRCHRCYDLRAAQALLQDIGPCIGVVDISHDDFSLNGVASLVNRNKQVRWLGLIRDDQLKNDAICQFIVSFCIDYFTSPVPNSQLMKTIGHQLGMLKLERHVWPHFGEHSDMGLLGKTSNMRKLRDQVRRVAPTDVSVLISGESGTGKELVALAIHNASSRSKGHFVSVKCSAVSEKALEEEANLKIGSEYCHSNLLNSPGNFTAAKLAWVAQNEPEIFDRIDKFMLPGDFIAMKMSGQAQTTFSGLSEGIFYDFVNDEVSSPLMNYFGFDSSVIPQIVPTFGIQSELSESAATFLGLKKGTKITYRAGDQPNNALSLNVLNPGEIAATAGTSGVVYGISDVLDNDPHSRVNAFRHVNHTDDQRRIGILLCINGTGILNAWARRNFGDHSYEEMNDLAMQVPPGSTGLTVLPFGNGAERLLSNKDIGAHISGLQFNIHDKRHVFRAIQEGIACSLKYGIEIMEDMNLKAQTIRAGKANLFLSPLFQKTLSNLTGATIEMYDTDGAQGAARGAGIGIGRFTETSAFDGLKLLNRVEPEADSKAQYAEIYQAWKQQLSHMI